MPTIDDESRGAGQDPPEPGDRRSSELVRDSRRLTEPPSARYGPRADTGRAGDEGAAGGSSSALRGPLLRATAVAVAGAILLTIVGAVLASTFGLLFVAGGAGAAIGLVLARAAVPAGDAAPVARDRVARVAAVLAVAAVVLAAVLTWVIARSEGGTLGIVDYLLQTFGPFVPAEAALAAIGAWWGASTGPVQA